jgi:hypothetical protein
VLPPVELTQAQSALYKELPEAIKVAVTTHVRNSSADMALDNVSAILIMAGLKSELRTEILKNNYITLREIKDAALKAERLRKEKPLKSNGSTVNEINEQEPEIDAINNRGNFQNNYRGNNSRGRGGYPRARGGYRGTKDPPTITKEHHQQIKAGAHSEEIVVTKIIEEAKTKTRVKTMTKTVVDIVKKPGHSVEKCCKLQAKKASMEVNNEDEYHDDPEQTQDSETPISTIYNAHSNSKNQ